jgi:hypothetical protein
MKSALAHQAVFAAYGWKSDLSGEEIFGRMNYV